MLSIINFSDAIYPLVMLGISALTFGLNAWVVRRSNLRFKKTEMDKKADVIFVEEKIAGVNNRINTEVRHMKELEEERTALLENINRKVEFIYEKHYKP
jgi:cell division protein FtsB